MIAGRGPESLRASKTEESDMADRQQGVVPHLVVDDAAAALEFYRKAFGATEGMRHPAEDGKRIMHAEITVNGARIFVRDALHAFSVGGWSTPDRRAGPEERRVREEVGSKVKH